MPIIEIGRYETNKIVIAEPLTGDFVRAIHATGFRIIAVDDKEEIGFCEFCGLPLFEGDDYREDEDGVMWHVACGGEE